MEYTKKFILVEPHKLDQLRLNKGESDVKLQTAGNISSHDIKKLHDEIQWQTNAALPPSPGDVVRKNDGRKHTCSYCWKMFAERTNYLRHLGLVHRVDVSGKPIDDITFHRYKNYNSRTNSNENGKHKHMTIITRTKLPLPFNANRKLIEEEGENTKCGACVADGDMISRKSHTIGQTSTKQRANKVRPMKKKKRTMSPEQRRLLRQKIMKNWLAY